MLANIMRSPIGLLLLTGILIGFNFPLGKIAGIAGVSPIVWALLVSLGATFFLLPKLLLQKHISWPSLKLLKYAVISGLVSFVVPNLLLFSTIPHAGAGYTGLMFALSPVFTLALALMFKMNAPSRLGILGIAIGLVGAAVVSVTRGAAPEAPALIWVFSAALIPLSLACGNVYRTLAWPKGASPDLLAFWCHMVAVATFLFLMVVNKQQSEVDVIYGLSEVPWAAGLQFIAAGLMFPIFFRLQKIGGPVLLSQIGYVAAAVGLLSSTVFLGETYSLFTWYGAVVIAAGIVVTIVAQKSN